MKKKILVVDNDLLITEFLLELLEGEGHRVKTANDGISAIEILTQFTPDVVFVDLVMGPDGYVGRFVEQSRLGIAVRDPATELVPALVSLAEDTLPFDPEYDITAHALPAAVEGLVDLLRGVEPRG